MRQPLIFAMSNVIPKTRYSAAQHNNPRKIYTKKFFFREFGLPNRENIYQNPVFSKFWYINSRKHIPKRSFSKK